MGDFAIVAEGITDQHVLENIIVGACAERFGPDILVNFEQPPNDATSSHGQPPPGGWTLVRHYLEQGRHREALQLNRYLVIHIDTDVAQEMGVETTGLADDSLVAAVIAKVHQWISRDVLQAAADRILFAICVDSIECWLLPLLADKSQPRIRRKRMSRSSQSPVAQGQPASTLDRE